MGILSDINDFWSFLEFLVQTYETSILYIDDDGNEQILYIEPVDKTHVRFFIAEQWKFITGFVEMKLKVIHLKMQTFF